MDGRKWARVRVSDDFLLQALGFPCGTKLIYVAKTDRVGEFQLTVEHDDLPFTPHGTVTPEITPTYEEIRFDWNLDSDK